jgi:hypothetical protein
VVVAAASFLLVGSLAMPWWSYRDVSAADLVTTQEASPFESDALERFRPGTGAYADWVGWALILQGTLLAVLLAKSLGVRALERTALSRPLLTSACLLLAVSTLFESLMPYGNQRRCRDCDTQIAGDSGTAMQAAVLGILLVLLVALVAARTLRWLRVRPPPPPPAPDYQALKEGAGESDRNPYPRQETLTPACPESSTNSSAWAM